MLTETILFVKLRKTLIKAIINEEDFIYLGKPKKW